MLADPEVQDHLNPATQFMHDWMHCIFVSGIFNITLWLTLRAIQQAGRRDIYSMLHEALKLWHWPKRLQQTKLFQLFVKSRQESNNDAKKFKCDASAGLSMYSVIALFLGSPAVGVAATAVYAYSVLSDLIDLFQAANRGNVSANDLLSKIEDFLDAFDAAFGPDKRTPKFHWLLHFSDILYTYGYLSLIHI